MTVNNLSSFKCKVNLLGNPVVDAANNKARLSVNIVVPSAIDGGIQKEMRGEGSRANEGIKFIIEQEDTNDIMKFIEALENSGILLKGVTKTIENEIKEQRGGFLSMLLGTLGAYLLGKGNMMSRAKGDRIVRAGEGSAASKKFAGTFSSINKYRNK